MRVWDSRTQSLTPEWLAKSCLVKDLTIWSVLATGSGPARVVALRETNGYIQIDLEFMLMDDDCGGRGQMILNPNGRLELHTGDTGASEPTTVNEDETK